VERRVSVNAKKRSWSKMLDTHQESREDQEQFRNDVQKKCPGGNEGKGHEQTGIYAGKREEVRNRKGSKDRVWLDS